MSPRVYSPDERIEAVSRVLAGESVQAVAAATGVTRSCLSRWTSEQRLIMAGRTSAALSHTARVEPLAAIAEATTRRTFRLINVRLDDCEPGSPIPYHEQPRLDSIARAMDYAHTAHLDYRDGRKGAEIHVDARSVMLAPLARLTTEELRALAAGGPLPAALEAGGAQGAAHGGGREAPAVQKAPTPQVDHGARKAEGPHRRSAGKSAATATGHADHQARVQEQPHSRGVRGGAAAAVSGKQQARALEKSADAAKGSAGVESVVQAGEGLGGGRSREALARREAKRQARRKEREGA